MVTGAAVSTGDFSARDLSTTGFSTTGFSTSALTLDLGSTGGVAATDSVAACAASVRLLASGRGSGFLVMAASAAPVLIARVSDAIGTIICFVMTPGVDGLFSARAAMVAGSFSAGALAIVSTGALAINGAPATSRRG